MRQIARFCAAYLSALSASGIASAAPPEPLPPYVQAYEPTNVDERGLWMEADEYERRLRDSPLVVRDEQLNAYVRRVLCRTVGDDRCGSVRIYVMEIPAFNATMMPNGAMTVWTGLLLRTRSEAELGAVLGHEFAHFELRHGLRGFRQRRLAGDLAAWAMVLGGIAATNTSALQFSLVASMFRFSRDQEAQADMLGMRYLHASSYPAMAASELWKHLMAESDATAAGRMQRPRQRYTAGFFDTHPTNLQRAAVLAAAASPLGDEGSAEVTGHRAAIASHLPLLLSGQTGLNDFGGTEYILGQLALVDGWTAPLLFARGELYRQRGNPRDLVTAAQFYGEAIAAGYSEPEAHRNLGLSLLRTGEGARGRAALAEYLRLRPDASDAATISTLMQN